MAKYPPMTRFWFYDKLGDLFQDEGAVFIWHGWKLICMKIHVSISTWKHLWLYWKKKIQDKVVACVVLEILKKIKYTYFSIFPHARSELFCNAKERSFDRALKTMYVYGFIKKILPFFSIMIHAFGKLLKWLILSCCTGTICYQCTTILVLKYMYPLKFVLYHIIGD